MSKDDRAARLAKYQFTSENQPENRGRKKSVYTVLKDKGYAKEDVRKVLEEMFWYTEQEARDMVKDVDAPMIAKITAKAMLGALKYGNMDKVTKMFEYVLGRPDSKISIRADHEKRIEEYMQSAQDIDYEDVSEQIGPPVQSEDKYKSMIQEFKNKMEAGK